MTDTRELKACPFCGNKPRSQWYGCDVPGMEDCGMWETACCYTAIHKDTQEEAEAAWQARALDSRCGELLTDLKKRSARWKLLGAEQSDLANQGFDIGLKWSARGAADCFTKCAMELDVEILRLQEAIAAFEASHEK